MRMKDQVVLITGASRGVGAACAVACAREGARLVLAAKTIDPDPRLPGTLDDVRRAVEAAGSEALVCQLDVRFAEQVDDVVAAAVDRFGRLDAVVNNAGAIFWAAVADWPVKKADLVMGVNVRGAFLVTHAALPHLRKQGGHVLMMSPPLAATRAAAGKAMYMVSKWGMTMLAEAVDLEEPNVAGHALWPVTAIETAATVNLGMGTRRDFRTPDILADATVELLTRDPKTSTFKAWLDEDVLAEAGITDLARYRCDPDHEPGPMSIQLVDPDWHR